jgi:hypothetical protein
MATDNKGVMVYLPSDLEEVLEKYCTENKITRKNKDGEPVPSMGTGIVHYLRSHLLGEVPSNVPNGFTLDDVRSLIDQAINPLTSDFVDLQSQSIGRDNWDDLKADVADLREQLTQLITTTAKKPHSPAIRTPSASMEPSKDIQAKINLLEDDPKLFARVKSGIEKGLSNAELGQWLDDGGFRNTKDETYKIDSVSRFRRALEYLTNPKMEVRPNG